MGSKKQAISKNASSFVVQTIDMGLIEYEKSLDFQLELHQKVRQDNSRGYLIFCEHPTVITLGRRGGIECLKISEEELLRRGVKVIQTERGGLATLHTEGQLVVYPIFPVERIGLKNITGKRFVEILEGAIIDWLRELGLEAEILENFPGMWVGGRKIGAVGVRISEGVSYHGAAINFNPDMNLFDLIVPCGISDKTVCCAAEFGVKLTERGAAIKALAKTIIARFSGKEGEG